MYLQQRYVVCIKNTTFLSLLQLNLAGEMIHEVQSDCNFYSVSETYETGIFAGANFKETFCFF